MIEYNFNEDWFTPNIPLFDEIKDYLKYEFGENLNCIEVGAWEGRSAIYLADNFIGDSGTLTLIDLGYRYKELYKNISLNPKHKQIKVMQGNSVELLPSLLRRGESYHFVFVDAGKTSADTLCNLLIAERLLKVNGIMIADDYGWGKLKNKEEKCSPQQGVDFFLESTLLCELYKPVDYTATIIKKKSNTSLIPLNM